MFCSSSSKYEVPTNATAEFSVFIETEDPRGQVAGVWAGDWITGNVTFDCGLTSSMQASDCFLEDEACEAKRWELMEMEELGWLYYHKVLDMSMVLPSGTTIKPNLDMKVHFMKDIHDKQFIAPPEWPIYITARARTEGSKACCPDPKTPTFKELKFFQPSPSAKLQGLEKIDWSKKGGFQYWDIDAYNGNAENFTKGYLGSVYYGNITTYSDKVAVAASETSSDWKPIVAITLIILAFALVLAAIQRRCRLRRMKKFHSLAVNNSENRQPKTFEEYQDDESKPSPPIEKSPEVGQIDMYSWQFQKDSETELT
jgi:hypothetical protein